LHVLTEIKDKDNISNYSGIKKEAGLYYFAILLSERKFLAAFLRHIQNYLDSQYYEGMADHSISESIYIHDPDFNGIEIYRDRLLSEWIWNCSKIHMVVEPLNIKDLLDQIEKETWNGLPSNTTIGHVHLHVSNLVRSKRFYQEILGFHHTASYPGVYFFAADSYHHYIATNTWIGTNILPANINHNKPGLDHYAVILPDDEKEINKLKNQLVKFGAPVDKAIIESDRQYSSSFSSSFYVYDPDKIKIQFLFNQLFDIFVVIIYSLNRLLNFLASFLDSN
jgi:catechol 2,3-dioxygenase